MYELGTNLKMYLQIHSRLASLIQMLIAPRQFHHCATAVPLGTSKPGNGCNDLICGSKDVLPPDHPGKTRVTRVFEGGEEGGGDEGEVMKVGCQR